MLGEVSYGPMECIKSNRLIWFVTKCLERLIHGYIDSLLHDIVIKARVKCYHDLFGTFSQVSRHRR